MINDTVLVIGSINKDITLTMDKLPSPGETVLADTLSQSLGGKGANQAVTVARMESPVVFVGALGKHVEDQEIMSFFEQERINTDYLLKKDAPTGSALITLDKNAENSIVVYPGANHDITCSDIDAILSLFDKAQYCVLQFEIPNTVNEYIIKKCKDKEIKLVVNPAPFNKDFDLTLLKDVDYYIPNQTEFVQTIGENVNKNYDIEFFKQKGLSFYEQYRTTLIITLGSKGSLLVNESGAHHVHAEKCLPVDTTAAGDSYIGSLVSSLTKGNDILTAMNFASKVAAQTVQKKGQLHQYQSYLIYNLEEIA